MKNLAKARNEGGITLIALVVTIIVLLILAGISIAMLTGENGILGRAKQASEITKDASEEEQVKLAVVNALINGTGTLSTDNINKAIQSQFGADKSVTGNGPWTFEGERNTYTIEKNGKIEKLEKSDINISLTIKGTPVEEKDIPIPEGFVHVGGSINEGFVISDVKEDEGKDVDSNDLKGNQFVWVPVDKDQKITAKVESKEDITSIIITNPFGDKIEEKNNVGKTYSNDSIEPTINGEYKIKVTTSKGETSKTLEVYSLYAQNSWVTDEIILKELEKELESIAKAEDMTVEELIAEETGGMSLDEFLAMLKSQYLTIYEETEDYKNNVNTNGGFYIGRYEAGDSSAESDRTESNSKTGELVIQKNKYVYNYISYDDALNKAQEYATNAETNVTSSLLTGAAWDRTLGWLYETGDKTIEELTEDSTSWGNYDYDTFFGKKNPKKTGESDKTKAKNIYDLAGNVSEWTTEDEKDDYGWLSRDGMSSINGVVSAYATLRWRHDTSNRQFMKEVGFRLALYL